MGVIPIITPKSVVVDEQPIAKCKTIPHAKELATLAPVPLEMYKNDRVYGLSKIEVK